MKFQRKTKNVGILKEPKCSIKTNIIMKTVPSHGLMPIKSALDVSVILSRPWMVSALGEQHVILSQEHEGLCASIWTALVPF